MSLFHTSKNFVLRHMLKPIVMVDQAVAQNPLHPSHERTLQKLNNPALKNKLVVTIITTKKTVANKAVVRSRVSRRLREAVFESLRERGYGREGQVLKDDGRNAPLIGTLHFYPTFDSLNEKWDDLKQEVGMVVDKLIAAKRKGGKRPGQTRGPQHWGGGNRDDSRGVGPRPARDTQDWGRRSEGPMQKPVGTNGKPSGASFRRFTPRNQ